MDIDDRHLRFLSMDIRLKDPCFVMAELAKNQQKIAALTEENAILTQSKSILAQSNDDLSHEVKMLREKDTSSDKKLKRFQKRIDVLYAEKLSLTEMEKLVLHLLLPLLILHHHPKIHLNSHLHPSLHPKPTLCHSLLLPLFHLLLLMLLLFLHPLLIQNGKKFKERTRGRIRKLPRKSILV